MFYIHKNIPNKTVKIHKAECGFCNNGLGNQQNIHGDQNSEWFPKNKFGFNSSNEAVEVAQSIASKIKTVVSYCKVCNPKN